MKNRLPALLLVLVLLCSWQLPAAAQAAETEPMVLQSAKHRSSLTHYYYDAKGNCVREESVNRGSAYEYSFDADNNMVQEKYFEDDRLVSQADYDAQGNLTARWQADETGKLQKVVEVNFAYDSYGRMTRQEQIGHEIGEDTIIQYEYHGPPRTLIFGAYDQDNNWENGNEPIEWIILDADGEYTLVVSKYGLDSQRYEKSGKGVSWNESDLRQFLNGEFWLFGFSFAERMNIKPVLLENTIGKDNIFLLSLEEAEQYLSSAEDRICIPTASALDNNAAADPQTGASWWHLRTAGSSDTQVARICADGSTDSKGVSVSETGGAVRPALWVKTSAVTYGPQTPRWIHTNVYFDDTEIKVPISETETYDDAGRLTSFLNHITNESKYFTYDAYGNVTEERIVALSESGEITNRISSENTYDEHGRMIKSIVCYEETCIDRSGKTEYDMSSTTTITCTYDTDGNMIRRVSKHDDGSTETEEWTYSTAGRLLWEISKSRNLTVTKIWTYEDDGSSTCQTSNQYSNKVTTERHEYDPYGNLLKEYADEILIKENTYVPLSQAQWKK